MTARILYYVRELCLTFDVACTISMLSSKSRYIGAETARSVKTSDVGVMTAATDNMSTTACLR